MNFEEVAERLEHAVRVGEIVSVQNEIDKLATSAIPRGLAARFGNIARRVRSESWGLRLLRPIVRPDELLSVAASNEERCAYAGLLLKIGAVPEARAILEPLEESGLTDVPTFLSQSYISEWNYGEAKRHLEALLARDDLSAYTRCITEMNLTASLVFLEKYAEAKTRLENIIAVSRENGWDLLYGNALELSAQLAVIQGAWTEAEQLLQEAEVRAGQHSHYRIFIEKWRALARLFQTKAGTVERESALTDVELIQRKAKTLSSWETVRDLDYQIATFLKHQNLLLNVYFGTPFLQYKRRIERTFKAAHWEIPTEYFRKLSAAPAGRIFDLESGDEYNSKLVEPLKPGMMLHRFLNILATDFYKPIGVGELFSKLFPDEYFNVDTSPDRVAQAVKQLRKWFERNHIPLDVEVENSRYGIRATGAYAFRVENQTKSPKELLDSGYEIQLKQLMMKWPYQSFSASKAAAHLDVSASSVRAILQRALLEAASFSLERGDRPFTDLKSSPFRLLQALAFLSLQKIIDVNVKSPP